MANIIEMPKLSDTMTVGTLVKWLKKEGDVVKSGDMLAEVETDKATMELECFFDGTLLKIFSPAGSQVALGAALCAVGKPGETVETPAPKAAPAAEAPKADAPRQEAPPASTPAPVAAQPTAAPSAPASFGDRIKISPLAKKLATEKGIDASLVTGSGPHGRIVREDILAAEKSGSAKAGSTSKSGGASSFAGGAVGAKGPIQQERTVAVSTMRGVIAKRLLESKTTIPHFYLDIEIDAEPLLALREQLNKGLEKAGVKLSVNDFILKGSAEALRRVPDVNAAWEGTQIRYLAAAHVSFAVALPDGLITPVVKDAHDKSIFQVSAEAKSLGKLAKDKKLKPDQFTGGTFCVSNLGMMGIPKFYPIINPPNAAILGVGTTVTKPVVKNGQIVVGQTLTLTLSADHRVVDGAVGAQFLAALKAVLESPALLLV
ncbi:MAG TPA: pyruvate dehydrogenase complex dihydrolipoamide acetyltransferase [Rariglobus sp.]|jgi:pyruvate dehydrogenase E2 component (dihydrolipoamide acetyltransferase)|nr:pyruvate dehydrogenase complex dihydrolipoamide acetyltransferase [Rariglobus sp.]